MGGRGKNYIAAAASLKLATVFDPDNDEYQKKHKVAADRAGEILAEQDRKQAKFHASVGRWEAASRAFARAWPSKQLPDSAGVHSPVTGGNPVPCTATVFAANPVRLDSRIFMADPVARRTEMDGL